jgi:hypothetical protein
VSDTFLSILYKFKALLAEHHVSLEHHIVQVYVIIMARAPCISRLGWAEDFDSGIHPLPLHVVHGLVNVSTTGEG